MTCVMLLDARQTCISEAEGVLCHAFNSASAGDTAAIGRAFARVIMQNGTPEFPEGRVLRVGVIAAIKAGKSTFVSGITDAFPDKNCIEKKPDKPSGTPQHLWRNREGMWLRHYDACLVRKDTCLTSYWNNDLDRQGSSLNDIVEHPYYDRNDTLFHCLIRIGHAFKNHANERCIVVTASEDLAGSPGFQEFLKEAAPFRARDF